MELYLYSLELPLSVVSKLSQTAALSQVDANGIELLGCEHCGQWRNAEVGAATCNSDIITNI